MHGCEYRSVRSPSDGRGLRRPRPTTIGDLHVWTLKERLQIFLDGPAGVTIEGVNVLLSLVLVAIAIADTYYDPELDNDGHLYQTFEVVCMVIFAIDYTMHLYAAQNVLSYLVSPVSIVDFVTIVPTLLTLAIKRLTLNSVLPILRIARVFRILAVLRLYRVMQSHRGFEYQLSVLIFLLLSLILVAAGVFQILEESYYTDRGLDPLQFHQAMYFVFVTFSTVGYGDIAPHTTEGQFFVMFIITVAVTVIPKQVTRLMELSSLQHTFMHNYSLRKRNIYNGGHVIVTGHVRLENASAFLREFYRPRQGRVNMDVVFIADDLPSKNLQALLLNVRYRRRTTYLKGNLLHEADAKRAHVEEAAAVFILANKRDPRQVEVMDALSVLQALAIDKIRFRVNLERQQQFEHENSDDDIDSINDGDHIELEENKQPLQQLESRPIRCFRQILSLNRTRGLRTITGVEVALNTSQLRDAIVARNVVCPGASALLLNLIYSPSERHVAQGRRSCTPWVAEYAGGLQNLIFPVVLPAFFAGLLFEHAAEKLYLRFHVMMIALYDRSAKYRCEKSIRLCPFGKRLQEDDLVFLIAPSSSDATLAVDSLQKQDLAFRRDRSASCNNFTSSDRPPSTNRLVPTTVDSGCKPTSSKSMSVLVFSSDTVLERQSVKSDSQTSEIVDVPTDSPSPSQGLYDDGLKKSVRVCATSSALASPSATSVSTATSSEFSTPPIFQQRRDLANLSLDIETRRKLHGQILLCGEFDQVHQLACYLD